MTGLRGSSRLAAPRFRVLSGMLRAPGICSACTRAWREHPRVGRPAEQGARRHDGQSLWACLPLQLIHRAGGELFSAARNPRRSTVSIICGTVTLAGSNVTTASFALRLTSARLAPFSPSRAFLTATGQAPHVIPSTARTTVEVAADAAWVKAESASIRARAETHRFIASLPYCGPCGTDLHS